MNEVPHIEITSENMNIIATGKNTCLQNWIDFYKDQNKELVDTLMYVLSNNSLSDQTHKRISKALKNVGTE